jgi:hypothetical protein
MESVYFSKSALKTFNRFGDILLPKQGEFPSFSEYGGIEHIDEIVSYAPSEDIGDLNTVLTLLNLMPTFVLRIIIVLCTGASKRNGPLSPLFRQLNFAIRGIVFACYYAERPGNNFKGKDPCDTVGYDMKRVLN